MQITLGCEIASYTQTKDRGFKIVLETGELREDQFAGLPKLYKKPLWATIGLNPIENFDDIKDQLPEALQQGPKHKSHSQRLRAVLFKLREKNKKGDSEDHYESMMEKIIAHYKKGLD